MAKPGLGYEHNRQGGSPTTRRTRWKGRRQVLPGSGCHGGGGDHDTATGAGDVILVGNPNVGKSVVFGCLTGAYVTVSNYPGTTVEVTRGRLSGGQAAVVDTPGIHSLVPFSDDERVTRDIVLGQDGATVVQVADAKNLARALAITLELAETGVPLVLVLNMADEAARRGFAIDVEDLVGMLGVPVVATVATRGVGIDKVVADLTRARPVSRHMVYDPEVEQAAEAVEACLDGAASPVLTRALALGFLAGDDDVLGAVVPPAVQEPVRSVRAALERRLGEPLAFALHRARMEEANRIAGAVVRRVGPGRRLAERLGRIAAHPLLGWPILAAVLYGMYLVVGVLAAGTLVDLVEKTVFGQWINPAAIRVADAVIRWGLARDFLVGQYGLITMGLTYGLAIVMPIATSFFLAFAVLEDSGYLPRLSVMLDRLFRVMGLNGKAVLPMILGLGCDTLATTATRILDTRRERVQVTLLLALGIPCSAQLGVVLGMIGSVGPGAVTLWAGVVAGVLLAVGFLAARVLPGERSDFILELPPMRRPRVTNVVVKTAARVEWYLKEVVPIFLIGTAALFTLDAVGALDVLIQGLRPLITGWLGLPAGATSAFIIGFLRRDYGAAGLFALAGTGALSPAQILVSLITLTLFVPCFANVMMIAKELGTRTAVRIVAFIFPFAFFVGGLVRLFLEATGWFGA